MNEETNTLLQDILAAQQELLSAYREESRRAEEFRNYIIEHHYCPVKSRIVSTV